MEITIDLKPFCDIENGRYALSQEFVRSGWRYGCDGHICVRVPTEEADTPEQAGKFPRVGEQFHKYAREDGFMPLESACGETKECGWRRCGCDVMRECAECFGTGESECRECGQDCECPECEGSGEQLGPSKSCPKCDGTGEVPRTVCKIGAGWFDVWYLDKTRALPNVTCAAVKNDRDECVLVFRFDGGGEGLLMGVRVY